MLRTVSNGVLTLVIIVVSTALFGCAGMSSPTPTVLEPRDELGAAFDQLVDTLRDVERDIRMQPAFVSEAERVGGYRHIMRSFAKGMEAEVLQDADYPYFRILDWWLREGGEIKSNLHQSFPLPWVSFFQWERLFETGWLPSARHSVPVGSRTSPYSKSDSITSSTDESTSLLGNENV